MKRIPIYLLTLFMACTVHAGTFTIDEYQGENLEESKILILPSKSPDMNNCDISEGGLSFERRLGQTLKFEITYPTWTIKSVGFVKNNSYERLVVGYGPHVEVFDTAWSSTGILHSSATVGQVWDFASFQGNVYATNGIDSPFLTDGNALTFLTGGIKHATSIVFFNDTAFMANWPEDHAGVAYSGYSDPTNWTTGVGPSDARFFSVADFGEKVVDLEILGNSVLILCSKSIMKAVGYENPYQIVEVDKTVGCKSKGSVITHLGNTYFLGSDGQYYKTNGTLVEDISSDEYFTAFDNTAISQRTSNFSTRTTQVEFATGVTSHTSTSISPGSVVLSTGTTTYTSAVDWTGWTLTNIDSTTVPGSLVLAKRGVFDDFTDGDFSSDPVWTVTGGATWAVVSNKLRKTQGTQDGISTPWDAKFKGKDTLDIEFKVTFIGQTSASDYLYFAVYQNGTSLGGSGNKVILRLYPDADKINFQVSDADSTTNPDVSTTFTLSTEYTIRVKQDGTNWTLYKNESSIHTMSTPNEAVTVTNNIVLYGNLVTSASTIDIDDITFDNMYQKSGQAVSSIINTDADEGFNIVWGLVDYTEIRPDLSSNTIQVRVSTDSAMGDNPAYTTFADGATFNSLASKQYVQIKSTMATSNFVATPELTDVTLDWATTGYYITPEFSLASINAWGIFEVDETLNEGTILYFTYSSNTIVSDGDLKDVVTWTAQTKDATIVVATNTYVWAKAEYSITVATQVPAVDAVTMNWVSGSDTTEDMTAFWDGERLYLGVSKTVASSTNDGVFVWDPDLNAWWSYKTGVFPGVITFWNNTFLIASSTAGVVYAFLEGETDNGADIAAYYRTKYLTATGGLSPFVTSLQYLGVVYDRQTSGNLLMDTYLNGNATAVDTYTFDQTGGNDIHFDLFKIPHSSNCRYFQFRIYNSAGSDFTLHSIFGETKEFNIRFGVQE